MSDPTKIVGYGPVGMKLIQETGEYLELEGFPFWCFPFVALILLEGNWVF